MLIGIDVGGTKIRAGLLDSKYRVQRIVERATQVERGKKIVLDNILLAIKGLNGVQVEGIGIAVRGLVDSKKGLVRDSTMMPGRFKGVKLAQVISRHTHKPVKIENDVNCFTLGEAVLGAGKGKTSVVGLTFGTGVGGGIVINGQIFRGANGGAGEIGHTLIDGCQPKWNCGQYGCFESLCSGTASEEIYKRLSGERFDAKEIEEKYKSGDRKAKKTYKMMSDYLAQGLANVVHFMDPEVIVIGGGFGRVKVYVDPAIKKVPKYVVYKEMKNIKIRYAKLGAHAGLIGAGLLFKEGK